ncbi:MAG TPA: hypothetical protein VNY78_09240 [Edaphobacter sp.]|jgi:hypothetical protein|nr:hypothetical protein [Edaphobacter sp.]
MKIIHRFGVTMLGSLFFVVASTLSAQTQLRFDRAWWNHLHDEEQTAFIFGYLDCRQIPHRPNVSAAKYQEFIASRTSTDAKAIPDAIEIAVHKLRSDPIPKRAEIWPESHGWLDGAYWGSGPVQSAWRETHRGFVEGYLACAKPDVTMSDVSYLVKKIDLHYLDEKKEHDKIADVLKPLFAEKNRP